MGNHEAWCLLLFYISLAVSFEFQNFNVVRDVTVGVSEEISCDCIVVLLPTNATRPEINVLEKLTFSIAAGYKANKTRTPKQIMTYSFQQYTISFNTDYKLTAGSCFKWVTLVMTSESTQAQLQELSKSYRFNKAVWLVFSNGSLHQDLQGVNLYFNSKFWVKPGFPQRINQFGNFSETTGFAKVKLPKIQPRKNFEGINLRAGFVEDWANKGGTPTMRPIDMFFTFVWHHIQRRLNFTTNFRMASKDGPGILLENGNWTGLIGMITQGKVDIILSELDYTPSRVRAIDHLLPLVSTGAQVYFPLEGYEFEWKAVFRPFHSYVWFALLGWIFVGSTILYYGSWIAEKFGLEASEKILFLDAMLFILKTLCLQGSSTVPKIWAFRIFFALSYLVATVILPSYSASLVSSLSMRTPAKPFENLTELADSNFQVIFMPNSSTGEFLMTAKDPKIKRIIEFLWVNDSKVTYNLKSALEYMCTHSKVAVLTVDGIDTKQYRLSNGDEMCEITSFEKRIYRIDQSMALAKNSPYANSINNLLLKMLETGNIRRYRELYVPSWRKSTPKVDIALRLLNVAEIFLILILGLVISITIFLVEYGWDLYTKHASTFHYVNY